MSLFKWECPKCNATANEHGHGDCHGRTRDYCCGFLCECDAETSESHGLVLSESCKNAYCHHCGWGGTFPKPPKSALPWEKKALAAGWIPPEARAKELKEAAK